ncbi:hypothetical protein RQN30_00605 [Arcanobacterium hippocoleae]
MKTNNKNPKLAAMSAAATLVFALFLPGVAHATTYSVDGYLDTGGHLI